jgi:hypothetical protein
MTPALDQGNALNKKLDGRISCISPRHVTNDDAGDPCSRSIKRQIMYVDKTF